MEGKPKTTRLFVALWPDEAIREQLRQWRDLWPWPQSAAPVATAKLHVTLHFLGNLPAEQVPELVEGLAVPFTPFSLELGIAKMWPHGLAVLEPHSEPEELLKLHGDLGWALLKLGLQPEARKFRPHVTLSRRAGNAAPPANGPAIDWDIRSYALVQSQPGDGGGYTVLKHYA